MTTFRRMIPRCRPLLLVFLAQSLTAAAADWVRPSINTNQPVWGLRGGLLWALPPAGFRSGEPRGLIRLGSPVLPDGGYDLINFIAIEPVVGGRRGFSELEQSQLDKAAGKRIWAAAQGRPTAMPPELFPGTIRKLPGGVEELEVPLWVEKFGNGAHVRLVVRQRSHRPDEIELSAFQEADSHPLEFCILTATMGNMARTRLLWLSDRALNSRELYSRHADTSFAPHRMFPLGQLHRTSEGDVLAAVTTDEEVPSAVLPFPGSRFWCYRGRKVTQFWRKPAGGFNEDLQVAVNARYTYWGSEKPIPGGVAFENFEMRERFHAGQRFIFGITRQTPQELGLKGT